MTDDHEAEARRLIDEALPSVNPTAEIAAALQPIVGEYVERLTVDLDDADSQAVSTAITKAALAGAEIGIAAMSGPRKAVLSKTGEEVIVVVEALLLGDGDPDLWAERFGAEQTDIG